MYRLLSLAVILVAAEACRPPPCHWSDGQLIDNYFEEAANELIQADRKIKQYCQDNTRHSVKYIFGESELKIAINCSGYQKKHYDVKSRNRVLMISAQNCDSGERFSDTRIIPQYLNIYQSKWAYEYNEFVLTVPYVYGKRYGSWLKTCDDVNEAILTVPEADQSEFNEYDEN